MSDGLTLKCKSKKKIAIDREKLEGDILNIDVKLEGESDEERYTLIATTKPQIRVVNYDTLGDGMTKTIEIEYPKNDANIKCYYSVDNGTSWIKYTKEIDLPNIQRENMLAKIEYEGRKTINKQVSYLDYIDVIKFTDVTWKDGKAQIGITSLNPEYIEYQINSTSGSWTKPVRASSESSVAVENLNNADIVYARINNGTDIVDTASITILDNIPPANFTIEVTDITYDGFKIAGSTQDSESGIASYTYVVAKKGEDIVSVSSTNAGTQNITKESINNERGTQTNEQENKNTGEQGYNINRVGNYDNSANNTSRSSNKLKFWTKWIIYKSKRSKTRI